jgi:hypothetical protein
LRGGSTPALRRGAGAALAALLLAAPAHAQQSGEAARTLPALIAETARRGCPNRDDPAAHRAWEAMRGHYHGPADSLAVSAAVLAFRGRMDEDRVGSFDVLPSVVTTQHGRPAATPGGTSTSGAYRSQWSNVIARYGYAVRAPAGWPSVWSYPPLDAALASHFADPLFARRTSLSLRHQADGRTAIVFCPARAYRRQPGIAGELLLDAGGALVEASWQHLTPEPHQGAGGRALFLPPARAGGPLLPERSVTFARDGDSYLEEVRVFVSWIVSPSPTGPAHVPIAAPPAAGQLDSPR